MKTLNDTLNAIANEIERTQRRPDNVEGVELVTGLLRSPEFREACSRVTTKLRALRPIKLEEVA